MPFDVMWFSKEYVLGICKMICIIEYFLFSTTGCLWDQITAAKEEFMLFKAFCLIILYVGL